MSKDIGRAWPFIPLGLDQIDGLKIDRGEGSYLIAEGGRKILDASAGAAVGNIGWGRDEVAEVVAKSLRKNSYVLPTFATEEREHLVQTLRDDWLPEGIQKVSFMGSGSEAVDNAIRLARQYQLSKGRSARYKVIGRKISYHGTSLAGLSAGGHALRRRDFEPLLIDTLHAPACYCLRCPMGKKPDTCMVECATDLENIILREGLDSIAAFIAEPIVGASGGALVPHHDYWVKVAEICRKYDIVLIADEVMTGFGRTGKPFAVDHWSIVPDIIVLGKGLSGGYATISGVATSEYFCQSLADAGIQPMYHTYGAHPASCAAANTVLQIIRRENLLDKVNVNSKLLEKKLEELKQHPNIAEIRGRGLLYAVELVKDKETLECFPVDLAVTTKIIVACLKRDCFVYFGGTGEVRDVILLAPHFISNETEIGIMVDILKEAINEVCLVYK